MPIQNYHNDLIDGPMHNRHDQNEINLCATYWIILICLFKETHGFKSVSTLDTKNITL